MAIKADILVSDRGEDVALMEPLLVAANWPQREEFTDLALELAQQSAGLSRSLPSGIRGSLAELARITNCYYSNLIEGYDTHPLEIEQALRDQLSANAAERDLQLEARAHVEVERWIDQGGLAGGLAAGKEGIREIHRRLCDLTPENLLWVMDPASKERLRVVPGEFRKYGVRVRDVVAISPGAIPRFLRHFEEVYGNLGKTESILAIAAAHHRLLWINPFLDGNGRVARLMSHAMLFERLETGGVWPMARGLARGLEEYRRLVADCDQTGRGDALPGFTRFFLRACLEEVNFMDSLVRPDRLRARILVWAEEEIHLGNLPAQAPGLLEAMLYRGEMPRGEVQSVIATGDRQARRIVAALVERGVLVSNTPASPLRLAFPAALAPRWMPGIFPEKS